jgi:aspartate/tyrosine/aromatic aminotransferase
VDLSRAQWDQVIALVVEKNLIPFMDIAYQGFGDGLEEDAYAIRAMVAAGVSFFVSNSSPRTSPSTASAAAACRSSARMPKRRAGCWAR